ncbi:MAG: outer membrane channel protein TolC [Gammaproteobacteria bacterium]|nr:MAG: outer membrane channel protein TolC [Gammaproteobacteria bacterium]
MSPSARLRPLCLLLIAAVPFPAAALDLAEVYRRAQTQDPQFLAEKAAWQAEATLPAQSRAALLPQLNARVTRNESENELLASDFCNIAPDACRLDAITESAEFGWSLQLRQSLYNHEYWARLHQAKARAAQAEASFQAARQDLILRSAQAYFAVLEAEDTLALAEAEVEALEKQLEQTRERHAVGLAARTDLTEAEAQYDQARAAQILAANALDAAREALWALTGLEAPQLARLRQDPPLRGPDPADKEAWVQRALAGNLRLKAAQFAAEQADAEVSARRAGHLPRLDLVASRVYTDASGENFGDNREQQNTVIGLELNIPLFAGFGTRARVREAVWREAAARDNLEATRRDVVRSTRNAYQQVLADIARVQALERALASAEAAHEATRAGYEVGTRNAVELLLALRNTFAARRDLAQARYAYIVDALRLKAAAGSLAEADLLAVNAWLK